MNWPLAHQLGSRAEVAYRLDLASTFLNFRNWETSTSHNSMDFWILLKNLKMWDRLGHSWWQLAGAQKQLPPLYSVPSKLPLFPSIWLQANFTVLFTSLVHGTGSQIRREYLVCIITVLILNWVKDLSASLTVFSRSMKREGKILSTRLRGVNFSMYIPMTPLCSREN